MARRGLLVLAIALVLGFGTAWFSGALLAQDRTADEELAYADGMFAEFSFGLAGEAFLLDGEHDLVRVSDPGRDLSLPQFTLEAWLKPDTVNRRARILSKDTNITGCVAPESVYSLRLEGSEAGDAGRAEFFFSTTANSASRTRANLCIAEYRVSSRVTVGKGTATSPATTSASSP